MPARRPRVSRSQVNRSMAVRCENARVVRLRQVAQVGQALVPGIHIDKIAVRDISVTPKRMRAPAGALCSSASLDIVAGRPKVGVNVQRQFQPLPVVPECMPYRP